MQYLLLCGIRLGVQKERISLCIGEARENVVAAKKQNPSCAGVVVWVGMRGCTPYVGGRRHLGLGRYVWGSTSDGKEGRAKAEKASGVVMEVAEV